MPKSRPRRKQIQRALPKKSSKWLYPTSRSCWTLGRAFIDSEGRKHVLGLREGSTESRESDALASEQYVIAGVKEGDAAAACGKGVYNSSATLGQVFSATMVLRSGREAAGEGQTVDPVITWTH